jgi:hypothetical protein
MRGSCADQKLKTCISLAHRAGGWTRKDMPLLMPDSVVGLLSAAMFSARLPVAPLVRPRAGGGPLFCIAPHKVSRVGAGGTPGMG